MITPASKHRLPGTPILCSSSESRLALAELESLSGALLPVLLALLDTRVAGEQTFGLQRLAQLDVELQKGAGDTHLHRIGLSANAAARHIGKDVKGRKHLDQYERPLGGDALLFGDEVLLETLLVAGKFPFPGAQKPASHARLPPPCSVVLNQICHSLS